MKILQEGDPILNQVAKEVSLPLDEETIDLLDKMIKFVENEDNKAAGLAAPQVGVSKRIFVINIGGNGIAFINPKIMKREGQKSGFVEVCLSVEEPVLVKRRPDVFVKSHTYSSEEFVENEMFWVRGFAGRAFQHELDHLNGILISSYKEDSN